MLRHLLTCGFVRILLCSWSMCWEKKTNKRVKREVFVSYRCAFCTLCKRIQAELRPLASRLSLEASLRGKRLPTWTWMSTDYVRRRHCFFKFSLGWAWLFLNADMEKKKSGSRSTLPESKHLKDFVGLFGFFFLLVFFFISLLHELHYWPSCTNIQHDLYMNECNAQ